MPLSLQLSINACSLTGAGRVRGVRVGPVVAILTRAEVGGSGTSSAVGRAGRAETLALLRFEGARRARCGNKEGGRENGQIYCCARHTDCLK